MWWYPTPGWVEKILLSSETSSCVSGLNRDCCNAGNNLYSHRRHEDNLKPVLQHNSVTSWRKDNESLRRLFWTCPSQKSLTSVLHWLVLQLCTRDTILCYLQTKSLVQGAVILYKPACVFTQENAIWHQRIQQCFSYRFLLSPFSILGWEIWGSDLFFLLNALLVFGKFRFHVLKGFCCQLQKSLFWFLEKSVSVPSTGVVRLKEMLSLSNGSCLGLESAPSSVEHA